jgi:hypothetical protein
MRPSLTSRPPLHLERRGQAIKLFSGLVIRHFNFFIITERYLIADVEELNAWLCSSAPLLLHKEKEMEDEASRLPTYNYLCPLKSCQIGFDQFVAQFLTFINTLCP